MKAEMAQLEVDMQRILPKTDKTGHNVVHGVAGAFLIVPWFFMDFKGADKIEFDAMRNRYNYLLILAGEKNCDMYNIEPIPTDEELKKKHKEQTTKQPNSKGDEDGEL